MKQELKACPNCPNVGWYVIADENGEQEQVQCQFCDAEPSSVFNVVNTLQSELDTLKQAVIDAVFEFQKNKSDCGADLNGKHSTTILCSNYALNILRSHGLLKE